MLRLYCDICFSLTPIHSQNFLLMRRNHFLILTQVGEVGEICLVNLSSFIINQLM